MTSDKPFTRRQRILLALNALDRRVLRLACEICGDRRRCWRWHVEVFDCPTCGTPIDEMHARFERVLPQQKPWPIAVYVSQPRTTYTMGSGATVTLTWPIYPEAS